MKTDFPGMAIFIIKTRRPWTSCHNSGNSYIVKTASLKWDGHLRPDGVNRPQWVKQINGRPFSWQGVSPWWVLHILLNCLPLILSISPHFPLHFCMWFMFVISSPLAICWHMYKYDPNQDTYESVIYNRIDTQICYRVLAKEQLWEDLSINGSVVFNPWLWISETPFAIHEGDTCATHLIINIPSYKRYSAEVSFR